MKLHKISILLFILEIIEFTFGAYGGSVRTSHMEGNKIYAYFNGQIYKDDGTYSCYSYRSYFFEGNYNDYVKGITLLRYIILNGR